MIKCQIFIFLYLLIYSSIIIIRKNDDKIKKKLLLLKSFCAYWGLNGRCIFKTNKT
ncbi:unknown [Prevotella sp. CAG:1092]|nr:unknown [Prevotella sp. CAG:1092]